MPSLYLIEFEQSERDGMRQTTVRIFDPTAPEETKVLAETVYQGSPPGLSFQIGETFTVLRLHGR